MAQRLGKKFFSRDTRVVARDLLGSQLVRIEEIDGRKIRIGGRIIETEAYCGEEDLGCHAKAGKTKRTAVMYGPPGYSYIYFTYGMHWLLCVVTRPEGQPEAVLIRGIDANEGMEQVEMLRGHQSRSEWTDGPGKLTQALNIHGEHNGMDMTRPEAIIFIEQGDKIPDEQVIVGPRIGLFTVPEPWKSKPWRYLVDMNIKMNAVGGNNEAS